MAETEQEQKRTVKIRVIEAGKPPAEIEVEEGTNVADALVGAGFSLKTSGNQQATVRHLQSSQDINGVALSETAVIAGGHYVITRDVQLG